MKSQQWMAGLGLAWLATAAGCCSLCREKTVIPPPLPRPISLGEQLHFLNVRALAMPGLTLSGTVVIRYVNDKGEHKQESADGKLLIRQRYGAEGLEDPGDLWLSGRVMSQEVFQAGKNTEKWWFFVQLDVKTAWVGKVGSGDLSHGAGPGVMRADMVLPVLGITEIQPHDGEAVAMLVNDAQRSNNVLIVKSTADGAGWVKREIVVDRDSGNVREVRLYDTAGILAVDAVLKDYREIKYRDGEDPPAGFVAPKFPYDILVSYPAQDASIHFVMGGDPGKIAELRSTMPIKPFETPTFEGLKVIQAGK